MRTNLNMQFVCSECKDSLELFFGYTKKNEEGASPSMTANSAYDISTVIQVKPCQRCLNKANKIKDKFKEIMEEIKNDAR